MTDTFPYRLSLAPSLAPYRPEIEHALDFVGRAHGLSRVEAADRILHYGPEPPAGALAVPSVLFPEGVRLGPDGIRANRAALDALAAGRGRAALFPQRGAVAEGRLAYDAIGLIFLMLARLEERDSPSLDRYGRFTHAAALATRFHSLAEPPADLAAHDLAAALIGGEPRKATAYEVLITHDVDRLRGYHRPLLPLRTAAAHLLKRGRPSSAIAGLWHAYLGGDPWRSARRLMSRSEAKGHQSRFYFMGPSRIPTDSPYALTMVPLLRRVIDSIRARGHVIGFHPGFGSATDSALWTKLKLGLEKIAEVRVNEGRQHVLGYDATMTPDIWANNGMALDLTLAFPETSGFRAGTCRRFNAYSLTRRRPLALEQASTALMDFGLFGGKYRDLPLQTALDEAVRVAETCRRYGGALVILQHLTRAEPVVERFFDAVIGEIA